MSNIRVLVVDDSALIRDVLSKTLAQDGDITVVGTAHDPLDARDKIKALNPDVVTLDIEMPNMNGLAFLQKIMRLRPLPVVMVSTLTTKGASETMLALELGAVDFVAKPGTEMAGGLEVFGATLREKVRFAAQSDVQARAHRAPSPDLPLKTAVAPEGALIAIGASTGGVEAIRQVLSSIPPDCPPIVIAQHMPDRMALERGTAYVAPGDFHLRVEKSSGQLKCRVTQDEQTSGHRPSVDVLFSSVAKVAGPMAVGAILTGMGRDGAQGLKAMREAGAFTIGQSQGSALIYGMPKAAFELGAVIEEASVEKIAGRLVSALMKLKAAA